MSSEARGSEWFTEKHAIVTLTVISIVLAGLVVLPYIQYVLFGIILAYVIWPLRQRLTQYLRKDMSAIVLTVATVIAIPIPFIYILMSATQQTLSFLERVEEADLDATSLEAMLNDRGIEIDVGRVLEENQELIADGLEIIAWRALDAVRSLPNIVIGLTITIFVLFVLLRDGDMLVRWSREMMPIRDEIRNEFEGRLHRLMQASVIGNVAAGLIQAVALGLGFWILGFDNVLFLTVLTFLVALLPLIGAFVVWVPLVVYLIAVGDIGTAGILFVVGALVSISDFYTRPVIIGHSAALNSAVIVVGVFGGLIAFGPIGLLIGPVLLGAAKIAIEAMMATQDVDTA